MMEMRVCVRLYFYFLIKKIKIFNPCNISKQNFVAMLINRLKKMSRQKLRKKIKKFENGNYAVFS
mgnify:CR=1 FL=1